MTTGSSVPPPVVPAPDGLRAAGLRWLDEDWLVLSFPLRSPVVPSSLTAAERDVLEGLLAGEINEDLATHRGTSTRTVANQVGSIFRKLGVSSRAELHALLHVGPTRSR